MTIVSHLLKKFFKSMTRHDGRPEASNGGVPKIVILYGSNSGNAEFIARETHAYLRQKDIACTCKNMSRYDAPQLAGEDIVLMVVSTYGEGVPPESAKKFFQALGRADMPALTGIQYAVCALGDSGYVHFCRAGKDLDERMHQLHATRLLPRTDCDSEYRNSATQWIDSVYRQLTDGPGQTATPWSPATPMATTPRKWFQASIAQRYALYHEGGPKECYHLSLAVEDADFTYQPGDSLGILPHNDPALVEELLQSLRYSGHETTDTPDGAASIRHQLLYRCEITSLTPSLLWQYADIVHHTDLYRLLGNSTKLDLYLQCCDVLDMVRDFPVPAIDPSAFLSLLNPRQHRLYSIASSIRVATGLADIAVRSVKHDYRNRQRLGACSVHLNQRLGVDDMVSVYLQTNPHFRLPIDPRVPVIMIGTGTGVAPFRAFLQERVATGATGKNWLLAGDHSSATGFVYQNEFEDYHRKGVLTSLTVVFSSDGITRSYVQHSLAKHGAEIIKWTDAGAHLYVCGQRLMANGVQQSFLDIVKHHKGINKEAAANYLHQLRREQRYSEDVY